MVLRGATSLRGELEGVGPENRFSGPTPSNTPRNDVAPLKTIPRHKNNRYINSYFPSFYVVGSGIEKKSGF
jgi:hypothetical protein